MEERHILFSIRSYFYNVKTSIFLILIAVFRKISKKHLQQR